MLKIYIYILRELKLYEHNSIVLIKKKKKNSTPSLEITLLTIFKIISAIIVSFCQELGRSYQI